MIAPGAAFEILELSEDKCYETYSLERGCNRPLQVKVRVEALRLKKSQKGRIIKFQIPIQIDGKGLKFLFLFVIYKPKITLS